MDYFRIMKVAAKRIADAVENGSNAVVSPMSIAIALNLLASGSNGETLDQFLRFLGAQDTAQLTSNSQRIISLLASPAAEDEEEAEENIQILDDALSEDLEPFGFISDRQPPPAARASARRRTRPSRGSAKPNRASASRGPTQYDQITCPKPQQTRPNRPNSHATTIMLTPPRPPSPYFVPIQPPTPSYLVLTPCPPPPPSPYYDPIPPPTPSYFVLTPCPPPHPSPYYDPIPPPTPSYFVLMPCPPPPPSPYFVPMLCPRPPSPRSYHHEPMMPDFGDGGPLPDDEQYSAVKETIFVMANALWVDGDDDHDPDGGSGSSPIIIKPSFAEISDSVYKALVIKNADSVNEGEKIKEEINSWAENETKGLIENLLSPTDKLSPPLCIANASYFKGSWQHPFANTRLGNFRLLNGRLARGVPFMTTQSEYYRFESHDDFKLLELPYWPNEAKTGPRFSMYIFLPHAKGGIRGLVARLNSNPAALHPFNFRLENEVLERVWMPKLRLSHGFDAREAARAGGLTLPFDRGCADFSNMAEGGGGNVCVGSMIQKAFVEVDEEGTMGPAARDCYEAFRQKPYVRPNLTFVADHPFLFMIVTRDFQPLFVGAVLDPLKE